MATLAEILAQATMDDNIEFAIGENKFKLADLRGMRGGVDKELRAAELKRQEAERTAMEAATLLEQLQAAGKNQPVVKKDANGYDWKTDPLYAPVVAELQSVLAIATKSAEEAAALKKSLEQTSAVYAYERLRSEYERAPESVRKSHKFEDLANEVIQGKEFDRFGLPTLSKRLEKLGEPDRIKAARDEAVAEARKQWEAEQNASAAKRGASRFSNRKDSQMPPNKRIEDITNEMVANDPDVQAAMRGETVQ